MGARLPCAGADAGRGDIAPGPGEVSGRAGTGVEMEDV